MACDGSVAAQEELHAEMPDKLEDRPAVRAKGCGGLRGQREPGALALDQRLFRAVDHPHGIPERAADIDTAAEAAVAQREVHLRPGQARGLRNHRHEHGLDGLPIDGSAVDLDEDGLGMAPVIEFDGQVTEPQPALGARTGAVSQPLRHGDV